MVRLGAVVHRDRCAVGLTTDLRGMTWQAPPDHLSRSPCPVLLRSLQPPLPLPPAGGCEEISMAFWAWASTT
jgi:hypothetical protein